MAAKQTPHQMRGALVVLAVLFGLWGALALYGALFDHRDTDKPAVAVVPPAPVQAPPAPAVSAFGDWHRQPMKGDGVFSFSDAAPWVLMAEEKGTGAGLIAVIDENTQLTTVKFLRFDSPRCRNVTRSASGIVSGSDTFIINGKRVEFMVGCTGHNEFAFPVTLVDQDALFDVTKARPLAMTLPDGTALHFHTHGFDNVEAIQKKATP